MSLHPPLRQDSLVEGEAVASEQLAERTPVESAAPEQRGRALPSTIGGVCYLVVMAAAAAGLVVVLTGHWRTGLIGMACSLGLAALFRAVLRTRDAGMLAVRNRWFDVGLLLAAGAGIWVLALSVPGY